MDAMQAYIQLDGRNNRKTSSPARATPPRDHGTESELYNSSGSRARYEAYSKLQASAVAFGESVPIPEIVAVGGQSDGKSSLLEALLGFRFNIREVEMGTRRPLMLQMIHDASATEPRCRLQEEDSDDYGQAISSASAVAEAIRSRTESFLKKIGTTVASKPIVMRAEYAFCPNLTIIDTPGFVLKAKKGELESTPDDILAMVRELAAPQHRILLFLQQSSVEWCSSLWLDSIRAIDPTLSRTIVVVSKFDNRLKEFAERWEVDRYLSAGGYLGDNARPFFVALPKERSSMSNDEFRRQIMKVDNEIVRHLRETITGGFDEEQFGNYIGFSNLRRHLEVELQRRYRQSAPATLALLERRCEEVAFELTSIDAQLKSTQDVACLRRAGMLHAGAVARHVVALLDGVSEPHPAEWGRTTDEERMESRLSKWPGVSSEIRPANAGLRMYGGASFERVLEEFRCAACSLDCPPISRVEVANILLAQAGRAGPAAAAVTIARAAAKSWLGPLLDTACDRLAHILTKLFDLALERIRIHESSNESSIYGDTLMKTNLAGYIAFHAALRRAHQRFIRELNKHCKDSVRDHLIAVTSAYSNQMKFGWESHPTMFSNGFGSGLSQNLSVPFCVEAQDFRESVPHFDAGNDTVDDENFPPKGSQMDRVNGESLSPGKERFPLKESQQTVPDTPSPEPSQAPSKRKDCVVINGGLNPSKKKGAAGLRLQHMNGGSKSDVYSEVCSLAADHFGKIREMLVKRTVPLTLNSGFLNPCRDLLSGEIGVDLFAVTDDRFMEMFIAPGAVEQLELHREALSKRCSTLNNCLDEFRALARSI